MKVCCVCGKELPNRYAVSGKCEEKACDNNFCSLHWGRGNHRCPGHGYQEHEHYNKGDQMSDKSADAKQEKKLDAAGIKKAMKDALVFAQKLGAGAATLLQKLKKDKSPQAMIATVEGHLAANITKRAEVSGRVERLYDEIAAKKKAFASAPKARQRVFEVELKSMLSTYKTAERELSILLDNERSLSLIKGRLNEIVAYGMTGVKESLIDDVIDEIEGKVADADAILDATRDLEKAGRRRDSESDSEDLWTELDGFGEQEIRKPDVEFPSDAGESAEHAAQVRKRKETAE